MTHIAWLGKKTPFCGNVCYGLTTTEELRERGYQTSFIHFDNPMRDGNNKTSLLANDPDVSLPYLIKSQVYTIPSLNAQRELRESLSRLKPDLVHASLTLSPLDFRLPELCHQLNLPLIATFHPAFDSKLRNLTANTQQLTYQLYAPSLAKYDKVIVFSDLQAEVLAKLGVKESRLEVIPNGIDIKKWNTLKPNNSQNELHFEIRKKLGSERIFIYMGRIASEKNVEALLRAWRFVQPKGCRLVIVGDGPLRPTLENHSIFNKEDNVFWWGYEADQNKRVALLQIAEVFLLPSLVEGLSIALLEAMATGRPVITTDTPGCRETVISELNGFLVPIKNSKELASSMKKFIDNPELAQRMGKESRAIAEKKYDVNKVNKEMINAMELD